MVLGWGEPSRAAPVAPYQHFQGDEESQVSGFMFCQPVESLAYRGDIFFCFSNEYEKCLIIF